MWFATKRVRVSELMSARTYKELISLREQQEVIWEDWKLRREDTEDAIFVERGIGEEFKLQYAREEYDETVLHHNGNAHEVGLEYLLSDSHSLKLRLKEDEEFFGLERRVEF